MSNGSDVPAPGSDGAATRYVQHAGEQSAIPDSEVSGRSGQGSGDHADMDDGWAVPVLAQPAPNAPTYRRSLFRR